jgi:hypothetical protein
MEVELQLHVFWITDIEEEWAALWSENITPKYRVLDIHLALGQNGKEKTLTPAANWTPFILSITSHKSHIHFPSLHSMKNGLKSGWNATFQKC